MTAGQGVAVNVEVGTNGVGPTVPVALGVQVGEGNGVRVGRRETGVDKGDVAKLGTQAVNPNTAPSTTIRKR